MNTHRVKACKCPNCDADLDATTDPTNQNNAPEAGDITICFYCETLLEFKEDMTLAEINIKELQPEVQDLVVASLAQMQAVKSNMTMH